MYNTQTNLTEKKRIFAYLVGSYRGYTAWERQLKNKFPEAKHGEGKTARYIFEPQKVWEFILQNESWKRQIEYKKIGDFWELSNKATPDDWYKYR